MDIDWKITKFVINRQLIQLIGLIVFSASLRDDNLFSINVGKSIYVCYLQQKCIQSALPQSHKLLIFDKNFRPSLSARLR